MKGIILAGGTGTRLGVLTKVVNKHLLPIYDRPMIMFPLQTLISMGIESIMVVTDRGRTGDFMNLLGSGRDYGVRFTFGLQDKAAGIADAISVARDFANEDPITVILGDNIFLGLSKQLQYTNNFAKIFLKKVNDPERFGVAHLENGEVVDILEKPKTFVSDLAVTGLYQYPPDVFDLIDTLSPSERNELEVTEVNKIFLKQRRLQYEIVETEWIDAGTVESLFEAQTKVRSYLINGKIKSKA
jgi:glucose-1-phosphate thymidylyltransferase